MIKLKHYLTESEDIPALVFHKTKYPGTNNYCLNATGTISQGKAVQFSVDLSGSKQDALEVMFNTRRSIIKPSIVKKHGGYEKLANDIWREICKIGKTVTPNDVRDYLSQEYSAVDGYSDLKILKELYCFRYNIQKR